MKDIIKRSLQSFMKEILKESKRSLSRFWMRLVLSLFFLFLSLFLPALSLGTKAPSSKKLFLIRESKNLLELQENLKKLNEERELKMACEIEEEQNKIPKACFSYSSSPTLSKEERLKVRSKASRLCRSVVKQSKSVSNLKKWQNILSLSSDCKNRLKEKEKILSYKEEDLM